MSAEYRTFAVLPRMVRRFLVDTRGATAIEYGLIAALIAVVCITAFANLGGSSGGSWGNMANKASNAMNK